MDPMGMPMMMMGGPMGGFGMGMGMRPPMDMMMGGYGGGFEGGFGGMPVALILLPCIQGLTSEALGCLPACMLAPIMAHDMYRDVQLTFVHNAYRVTYWIGLR